MAIYLLLFIFLFLFHILFRNEVGIKSEIKKTKDILFLALTCLIISIVEGLRAYSVGTDTHGYVSSFILLDEAYESYEICSKLLVDFVRYFSVNPTVYLIVCALLTNGLIFLAIYRLSVDRRYSVFLFISLLFYFTSFNALRQAIAYSFVLNAFYYIREKKYIRYGLFVLIAIGFHSSALLSLLFLFIPIVSFFRKKLFRSKPSFLSDFVIVAIVLVAAIVVYKDYDSLVNSSVYFFPRYEVYLYNDYRNMTGGIQQPIVYTAIFLCFVFLVPNSSKYKYYYLLPLAIAVIISFASLRIAYLARFMYFFDITSIISIPYMFKYNCLSSKRDVGIFKTVVSIVCVAFLIYGLLNNYMRVADYVFVGG